jgi:cytoskeletal protein CcmA (bactofilin family)
MWKRDEAQDSPPVSPGSPPPVSAPAPRGGDRATIGRSIRIRGEVSGDEDLLIQGRVEGTVDLKAHAVTVGPEGHVKADVTARVLTVEGRVEGNLKAEEQLILRSSARVEGDLSAPRVVLEDGARFRGGIDMGDPAERGESRERGKTAGVPSDPPSTRGPAPSGAAGKEANGLEGSGKDAGAKSDSGTPGASSSRAAAPARG